MHKTAMRRKLALNRCSGGRRTRRSRRGSATSGVSKERRLALRHADCKVAAPCRVIQGADDLAAAVLSSLSPGQKGRLTDLLNF